MYLADIQTLDNHLRFPRITTQGSREQLGTMAPVGSEGQKGWSIRPCPG